MAQGLAGHQEKSDQEAMQRIFRHEVYGVIAAGVAAGISYRAGVDYLPSVLLMIAGFLMMGVFAELEDEVLEKIDDHSIGSHDWHLLVLRVIRTIVLLSIGILIFVALGRQF